LRPLEDETVLAHSRLKERGPPDRWSDASVGVKILRQCNGLQQKLGTNTVRRRLGGDEVHVKALRKHAAEHVWVLLDEASALTLRAQLRNGGERLDRGPRNVD
jgi:hypothetical protein